jgi:carbon storage regulator CsrA
MTMLVMTIKNGGKVFLGPDIEVTVVKIGDGSVRLGFTAPDSVGIARAELLDCDAKPKPHIKRGAE